MAVASSFSEIVIQKKIISGFFIWGMGDGGGGGVIFFVKYMANWNPLIFCVGGGTNITCTTKKCKQKYIFKDLNRILMINPFVIFYF